MPGPSEMPERRSLSNAEEDRLDSQDDLSKAYEFYRVEADQVLDLLGDISSGIANHTKDESLRTDNVFYRAALMIREEAL